LAGPRDPIRDRPVASHVRSDGTAKISYVAEAEAVLTANLMWARTGRPCGVYVCSQKPLHWHIGSGASHIRENQ